MKETKTVIPYSWIYYCDFWVSHNQNSSCNCAKEYWMFPICFQEKVFAQFPKVKYNKDITHSMRMMIIGK